MIRIAIVEDDANAAKTLENYIEKFAGDHKLKQKTEIFDSAEAFFASEQNFNVLLLDILLPTQDGLSIAHQVRKSNNDVCIIFVTNMAQFAIRGYEVNASDFIVKPVLYNDFAFKFRRVLKNVALTRHNGKTLSITPAKGGIYNFHVRDLLYVEVIRHKLIYHFAADTEETYGALKTVEQDLKKYNFIMCNRYCLINPVHVKYVKDRSVKVGEDILTISQPKYKAFMSAINDWLGSGG